MVHWRMTGGFNDNIDCMKESSLYRYNAELRWLKAIATHITYPVSSTHGQASHPLLESSFFFGIRENVVPCGHWVYTNICSPYHGIFPPHLHFPRPVLTKPCALGNKRDSKSRFTILSVHLQGHGHGVATYTKHAPLCFNCQLLQPARDAKDNHPARCFPG